MIITRERARQIAHRAMKLKKYDIYHFIGWYHIWSDPKDLENHWVTAINKEPDHFAVYVALNGDKSYGYWDYTSELNEFELADLLVKLAEDLDITYKTRQ